MAHVAVSINGQDRETTAASLAELLAELGFSDARVATAVNGRFVSGQDRAATRITPGDRIEVVSPRQGG